MGRFSALVPFVALLFGCSGSPLRNTGDGSTDHPVEAPAADGGAPDLVDADAVAPDGGPALDGAADGPASGPASFVVTANLVKTGGGSAGSHTFTINVAGNRTSAILGPSSSASAVTLGPVAAGYRVLSSLSFPIPNGACGGAVSYADLTFSIGADGNLSGTGRGSLHTISGDVGLSENVTMSLEGVPDQIAPSLNVRPSGDPADPFTFLEISSSEPLPVGARARLVSANGGEVPFDAVSPTSSFVSGFILPTKLLPFGQTFQLVADGIVDFAGNTAAAAPFRFTTNAAPPFVVEDGFESAAGASLGGAQVLSGAGLPIIAGARSLYIPPVDNGFSGRLRTVQLALRLAIARGDTAVRFSYRTVVRTGAGATGFLAIGSVGGTIGGMSLPLETAYPDAATIPDGGQVMMGPLKNVAIPLPLGATGEIVFARIDNGAASAACSLPPRPLAGIILDDLRVE